MTDRIDNLRKILHNEESRVTRLEEQRDYYQQRANGTQQSVDIQKSRVETIKKQIKESE